MTTTHTRNRERHDWGTLLAGLVALTALAAAVLLAISLAPASAETPAQRCKRETTAYNNAWKAIGKKPPVPYKCGGNNNTPPPPPPLTQSTKPKPPSATTESTEPADDSGPSGSTPTVRKDNENGVNPTQPSITGTEPKPRNSPSVSAQAPKLINDPRYSKTVQLRNGDIVTLVTLLREEAIASGLASREALGAYILRSPRISLDGNAPFSTSKRPVGRKQVAAPTTCWRFIPRIGKGNTAAGLVGTGQMDWCGDGKWIRYTHASCDGFSGTATFTWDYIGCEQDQQFGVGWSLWEVNTHWTFCAAQVTPWGGCVSKIHRRQGLHFFPDGTGVTTYYD